MSSRISKELHMLSPELPPLSDRDRGRHSGLCSGGTRQQQSLQQLAMPVPGTVAEEAPPPPTMDEDEATENRKGYNLRARMLNELGGGDIAADLDCGGLENKENDELMILLPPARGNGKHSFTAINPVNVLLPLDVLVSTFEKLLICPNVDCASKKMANNSLLVENTLKVEFEQYGFATELFITCRCCSFSTAICPPATQQKGNTPNSTPVKKKQEQRLGAVSCVRN